MDILRAAGVAVISGALVGAELSDVSKPHAPYNVPAPTVNLVDFTPTVNVHAQMTAPISVPMDYQTLAHQGKLILEIKG